MQPSIRIIIGFPDPRSLFLHLADDCPVYAQLAKLRGQVGSLVAELEAVFARLLAKVQPLAFLASPPYITYVTGAVLAAPLLTVLLPLLLLGKVCS